MCVHTCTRAVRGSLKPLLALVRALPLLALRAGARIPRAGKPRRSRNPHTAPTLLCTTTAGAAGECPTLACLPRIVELARIRLRVGVEAPSFERCRLLTNQAPLCCVHTPTRGHTRPVGTSAPSAGRGAGLTFVTGTGAIFCFSSSTGAPGIVSSPKITPVHPASTRMPSA